MLKSAFFWLAAVVAWLVTAFVPVIPWYKGGTLVGYWPLYVVYFAGSDAVVEAASWGALHLVAAGILAAAVWWLRNGKRVRQ